jgi:hypothetical protein
MSKTSRVATAVAAGYVLGRFKKLRMAVMVGSALANDNVRNAALGYIKKGSGRFSSASPGGTLTQQLGGKLVDAGKAAALAAAASKVDSISDRMAARSQSLRGTDGDTPSEDESEPQDEYEEEAGPAASEKAEAADEEDEEAAEEDEEAEEPVTRSRRRGRSASPGRRSGV